MHKEELMAQHNESRSQQENSIFHLDHAIRNTLVLVLAGGQGSRLGELTRNCSKPAVEFAANYKIIDFVLSNCLNSGFKKMGILTQYKSHCLIRHLFKGWGHLNFDHDGLMEVLPAAQQKGDNWYSGTADACYQNMRFIEAEMPKYVMVLSGDHIYKQDYRGFLKSHLANKAQLSVSCIRVPVEEAAGQFGVMSVDGSDKIIDFQEKPQNPDALPDQPGLTLASMGNYIFDAEFLLSQLKSDAADSHSHHDFGKNIIPALINNKRVFAYQYCQSPTGNKPYWRDVGTLDSYWQAHMDLLQANSPFNIQDHSWPVFSWQPPRPPTLISSETDGKRHSTASKVEVDNSLIANGCCLQGCYVSNSVVSGNCQLLDACVVDHSVILSGCKIGKAVRLNKVILEPECNVPDGLLIDAEAIATQGNEFPVTPKGILVVTQAMIDSMLEQTAHSASQELIKAREVPNVFMPLKCRRKHTSYMNDLSYSGSC